MTLCWICKTNPADSGEHMHKRSDLLALFGNRTQANPLYFNDFTRENRIIGSLKSPVLHSPIRICSYCNNTRTQPHDLAWEEMSAALRGYGLKIGQWLRADSVFPYRTRAHMIRMHLYFIKQFGCLLEQSKAVGKDVGIDVDGFSNAIMTGKPHPDVLLRFGVNDGVVGRSTLYAPKTKTGAIYASWLYQPGKIAVEVTYAPRKDWEIPPGFWHPDDPHFSRRMLIVDMRFKQMFALHEARERIVRSLVFRSRGT